MEESSAAAVAPLPSEPAVHENGAAPYAVTEDPAAADEDDGFETASDPDVDDDSPAPKNPNPIDPEEDSSDLAPAGGGGGGGVEFVEAESEISDAGAKEKEMVTAAVDEKGEVAAAAVPETVEVVPDAAVEKEEASLDNFEEAVAEVAEDSKPDERDEEVENSGVLESKEVENLIPNEALESDTADANQEIESVEEPKAVGVESDAAVAVKKGGDIDAAVARDVLEREDSKPVEAEAAGEAEEAGTDDVAVSDDGAKTVNESSLDTHTLESTEPKIAASVIENAEGVEGVLVIAGSAETEAPVDVVVSENAQESAAKPDGENVTDSIADAVVPENAQESAEKPDGEKITESTVDAVVSENAQDSAEKPDGEKVTESIVDVVDSENAQASVKKQDDGKVAESIVDALDSENAQEPTQKPDGGKASESINDVVDSESAESADKPEDEKVAESLVAVTDSENTQDSVNKPEVKKVTVSIVDVVDSELDQGSAGKPDVEKVTDSIVDVVDSERAQDSADIYDGEKSTEAIVSVGGAKKDEGIDGGSVSEVANDTADKHGVLSDGEAVDRATESVQKVESAPILQEESKSREVEPVSVVEREVEPTNIGAHATTDTATASSDDDENLGRDESEEDDDILVSGGPARIAILESSETAKQIIKEMEEGSASASSHSGFRSSGERLLPMDGQIVSDSDEEVDTDEEGEGGELFDSAALTALLKAATGASTDGGITISSQDGTRIFSVDRPAGLGSSMPALRPAAPRSSRPSPFTPSDLTVVAEPENDMDEGEKKLQEKVEQIRVKFLRLVHRLGHSPEDTVVAQVLYRLGLAEGIRRGRQIGRGFSNESAKKKALQLEEDKREDLDFSCNILVLGKTGVGKSATINSIFGERKSLTNAFQPATTSVREISGTVDGVKVRVIDTPGLKASVMDQAANQKVLHAIKKYTKRCPPDIVLYVDRMDTQTRDFNDLPLLRSITSILGSSIWFNAIVALSHAASAPPDGPNGSPLSYEVFIAQRSHVVQHSIRQAAGDMRLMNPVALVENHPSCRRNREGERVLPNGLSWRPQLLLLCYSSKILSEANSLLKLQDPSPGKLFGFRVRSPPLPYLLSSLLQSRAHPKLPTDQGGDNGDSDIDLDDLSDADQEEEEDEYDQLPPFKPLRKAQIAKLTKEQRMAYFDEYDYRVKLLQKKQWKDELRRLKEMKKKGKPEQDEFAYGEMVDDYDQDGAPAAVPVPLPDMVLPPSFDCDNPVYRYRFLEPTSQLLIRPVLDSHSWDHDCGYDGVSIEENLAIAGQFPAGVAVQITKDKKEFSVHLDSSIATKHGENGSTLAGFDIQSIGKQLAYILRGETKFKNLKKNKTAAGISVTFLGETIATGLKIEDQVSIGKRVNLVASTGAIRAQGDVAYGANLEARLKDKDYPIGQALSTLGLSLMKWRSDLALGANLQSQFSVGRNSKVAVRVGLNNKLTGQITVRTSTSEQLQIALVGIVPLALTFFRSIFPGESYMVN